MIFKEVWRSLETSSRPTELQGDIVLRDNSIIVVILILGRRGNHQPKSFRPCHCTVLFETLKKPGFQRFVYKHSQAEKKLAQ
jgi:hypothetical protein